MALSVLQAKEHLLRRVSLMATRRIVHIIVTLDPFREVKLPCDEFVLDEQEGVQVYYDGILWGYFPAVEYVYVEDVESNDVTLTLPQERPEIVLNGALPERPSYASFTEVDEDEDDVEDDSEDEDVEDDAEDEEDGTELPVSR